VDLIPLKRLSAVISSEHGKNRPVKRKILAGGVISVSNQEKRKKL
jgi:hypothetical protein